MKALFGIVSLLVVLAAVGLLTARSLHGTPSLGTAVAPAATATRTEAATATVAAPSTGAAGATLREQSQRLQQRVADDAAHALEQGAAAREAESGK